MVDVPANFRAAAAWAEGRAFGDAAGMAVREVLNELTGPPRIGVCTVDAPVRVTVPGARMVHTHWPAVGSGTDVVLLIHAGEVPGRVRSRMRVGPQEFIHIEDKEQAENYTIGVPELLRIREKLLTCELHALSVRFPELSGLVPDPVVPQGTGAPRVVVIGPDVDRVAEIRAVLAAHVEVVTSADADVVVAVPGGRGFLLVDAPTIQDAWRRVGRLVTLSPLPDGVCPQAVPAGWDLVDTVRRVARHPAGWDVPPVPDIRWVQAVERMERQWHRERHRQVLDMRLAGDRRGMREWATRHGYVLPAEPVLTAVDLATGSGWVLGMCILRPDALPLGALVLILYLVQRRRRVVARWWDTVPHALELDTTSARAGTGRGPVHWLRGQVHRAGRGR